MTKLGAWGLVLLTFTALATWEGVAPATKEWQLSGQDGWNKTIAKRDRAIIHGVVTKREYDPDEGKTRVELEADDGSPVTVYQSPTISGIEWPDYGERVEVKGQQLGPGKFVLVDHRAVKWIAPRAADPDSTSSLYGSIKLIDRTESGAYHASVEFDGGLVGLVLIPAELMHKVREEHTYKVYGYYRGDELWVTRIET